MKKIALFLLVVLTAAPVVCAQWKLQTNPLGITDTAMLGKIQFVSATEGWIACGRNGNLLHTTDAGLNWNVVTPYPGENTGNMSDPGISMSWTNALHGWALKTYLAGNDDLYEQGNGGVLYKTADGGNSWTKHAFPKSKSTITYSNSDLEGTWYVHKLSTINPNSIDKKNGWEHGILTIDVHGNASETSVVTNTGTKNDVQGITLQLSSTGEITNGLPSSFHGFMSSDKQSFFCTNTENQSSSYSVFIVQKAHPATTYSIADLQGTWQMHVLSAGDNVGAHSGWGHASLTVDASGNLSGNFVDAGGSGTFNSSVSISSNGIVSGMNELSSNFHGFLSADKTVFYATMTGTSTQDYNLVAFQKQVTGVTYSLADLQGIWQSHTLVSDNVNDMNAWANWSYSKAFVDAQGNARISDLIVNGDKRDGPSSSISLTSNGVVAFSEIPNSHGFMGFDKSLVIMTMPDMGSGGFTFGILQKDQSISGDIGFQVQFVDNNIGWMSIYNPIYGSFTIHKTTDGGTTWNSLSSTTGGIFHFVDANHGWMIGNTMSNLGSNGLNNIYKTTNGGASWEVQKTAIGEANALHFTDLSNGWVVGSRGLAIKTSDGGTNWNAMATSELTSESNSKTLYFTDANHGWIASHNDGDETPFVIATKDGGLSWIKQQVPISNSIFSLFFWDNLNGWLVGDYGQILQYIAPKTVTISAGGLSSALTTNEKESLTELTINGEMDVRDFKTVRNEMPLLEKLDISGATVVAYIGTEGTINSNYSYPANTIPRNALFNKTSLQNVVLPNNLTAIGRSGFNGCSSLYDVTLPTTLSIIDTLSFYNCTSLTQITIPLNVSKIDYAAFAYSGLEHIILNNGLKIFGNYVFSNCYKLQAIEIPSTVDKIGDCAFLFSGLKQITVNEGLKEIGDYAFQSCDSLTSLSIPASVEHIGYCALTFVNALKEISVASGNTTYASVNGVLFDKAEKRLIAYPAAKSKHYDIPIGVTVIDTAAFEGNWNLLSVTIPSSTTELAPEAFYKCYSLSVIDLPTSIAKIGNYCFYDCSNLSGVFTNTQTPLKMAVSDSIFKNLNTGCTLYLPKGSLANYQASEGWSHYISRFKEFEKVTDNEGNVYHGIQVGSQVWLVENLRTKHFNNHEAIDTTIYATFNLTNYPGAKYCWNVDNEKSTNYVFGQLYSWNVATDSRGICPTGWRIPNLNDLQTMTTYVTNNSSTSLTKSMAATTAWWEVPNAPENTPSYDMSINNQSGLLFFPSGIRHTEGSFEGIHSVSFLWTSEYQYGMPYAYIIGIYDTIIGSNRYRAQEGFSVRCMRDGLVEALGTIKSDGKIDIYPNPVSNDFQLKGVDGKATISVLDLNGRTLFTKQLSTNDAVSTQTLTNGMYLLEIICNNTRTVRKLVIRHQ